MSRMASAWLEIIEQILGDFYVLDNATPDWLVDGETGRRLKVDQLYPELGLALHFKGSLGAARSVHLDEIELLEKDVRDTLRARLCHRAGIALVVVDAESDAPGDALNQLHTVLSAAARRIAQREVAKEAKLSLLPRVASAKETCQRILAQVSSPEDLMPFVQAWEDRQFGQGESSAAVNY